MLHDTHDVSMKLYTGPEFSRILYNIFVHTICPQHYKNIVFDRIRSQAKYLIAFSSMF